MLLALSRQLRLVTASRCHLQTLRRLSTCTESPSLTLAPEHDVPPGIMAIMRKLKGRVLGLLDIEIEAKPVLGGGLVRRHTLQ